MVRGRNDPGPAPGVAGRRGLEPVVLGLLVPPAGTVRVVVAARRRPGALGRAVPAAAVFPRAGSARTRGGRRMRARSLLLPRRTTSPCVRSAPCAVTPP